jgi:hypothetical protein
MLRRSDRLRNCSELMENIVSDSASCSGGREGGYATVQQIVAYGETLLFLYWLLYRGGGFVCWGFPVPRMIKG